MILMPKPDADTNTHTAPLREVWTDISEASKRVSISVVPFDVSFVASFKKKTDPQPKISRWLPFSCDPISRGGAVTMQTYYTLLHRSQYKYTILTMILVPEPDADTTTHGRTDDKFNTRTRRFKAPGADERAVITLSE